MTKIQNGIGDKVAMVIQSTTMFFTGFIIGFVYSWKLTLVILSLTPALMITGGITGKVSIFNGFCLCRCNSHSQDYSKNILSKIVPL